MRVRMRPHELFVEAADGGGGRQFDRGQLPQGAGLLHRGGAEIDMRVIGGHVVRHPGSLQHPHRKL